MKFSPLPLRSALTDKPNMLYPAASTYQVVNSLAAFVRNAAIALFIVILLFSNTPLYADSLSEITLIAPQNSLSSDSAMTKQDSSSIGGDKTRQEVPSAIDDSENNELENIVVLTKSIRAYGWGEYEVGGRCVCCDNMLDGDCIIVHNTNRTEKKRIKQIVDGRIEANTNDESTYFGDLTERERSDHVTTLMTDITLIKQHNIYKVIVYIMADKEKKSLFISNCELGYYDQFDRLQWAGKMKFEADDNHVTFDMKKPIFTGNLIIKTFGGKNKITEVAIFCKKSKQ